MTMITLKLTDKQIEALAGLLDAAVRAVGLRAVKDTAELLKIIELASERNDKK